MSMILCCSCAGIVDAKDYGLNGLYEDANPYRYWCPECVTEPEALKTMKKQDPDRYFELIGDYE